MTSEYQCATSTDGECDIEFNQATGFVARPFFLVASERSGTTLTSVILNHHPQIAFFDAYFCIATLDDDDDAWPELSGILLLPGVRLHLPDGQVNDRHELGLPSSRRQLHASASLAVGKADRGSEDPRQLSPECFVSGLTRDSYTWFATGVM